MYEVRQMLWKNWSEESERRTLLLAAAFLIAFAYFGWKYSAGEEVTFPVLGGVCGWMDSILEQAGDAQSIGNFIHEVFFHGAANSL